MWLLVIAALLISTAAHAQRTPLFQDGTVEAHDVPKFATNGLATKGAGLSGDTGGRGLNPFSVTDGSAPGAVGNIPGLGICSNSNNTGVAYWAACIGHDSVGNALLTADAYEGATAMGFKVRINGVFYDFPGTGLGNVLGPSPTIVNELASWNSTGGTALRQGAAQITDDKTGAFTTDDGGLTIRSKPGIEAMDVAIITCGGCAYKNYDAIRGVAIANAGNDVINTTAIAGYVRNQQATGLLGLSKNAVALIGFATGEVDGAATWGLNTVTMDNSSATIITTDVIGRSIVGYEADINVMGALSPAFGVYIIGNSLVQPAVANGYTCAPLGDPNGVVVNPIHWISCFITNDGAAIYGLALGANSRSGANVGSQVIDFAYFNAAGVRHRADLGIVAGTPRTLLLTSTEGVGTVGLSVQGDFYQPEPTAAHFMGSNSKAVLITDAPDNLFVASGAWTTISLGTAGSVMTVNSPTHMNHRFRLTNTAVGSLPACDASMIGAMYTVVDALAPTYGATVAAGGAVVTPVVCDGVSAWKAH